MASMFELQPFLSKIGLSNPGQPVTGANVAPGGGFQFQDPTKGMGFFDQMKYYQQNNPEVLMNFASGMLAGDTSKAISGASSAMSDTRKEEREKQALAVQQNSTLEYLVSKGYSREEATAAVNDPEILRAILAGKESSLINAGDGNLYDPSTGEWIQAPNSGNRKAPTVVELFDENGQPYKAQWNPETGTYERLGGSKAPTPKAPTEQVVRNRQLYSVVKPEADTLLGTGETPGVFDSLGSGWDQAGSAVAGGLKEITGLDASGVLTSAPYQRAKNSVKSIYSSYIYSVSGASAPESEIERQASLLMPIPGEPAEATQAKKDRIKTMVDAIRLVAEGGTPSAAGGNTSIRDLSDEELEAIANGQ